MVGPNKNTLFPLPHYQRLCYLKNLVTNSNIVVGDYTYYDDFESVENFEKNVKYLFDFTGDKLIIGKFCMIASGATFVLNGGNHVTEAISAYPFAIFGHGWQHAMDGKTYPNKGDIVIGNDVWIGYNATILAGVRIGDGAIIGMNATVAKDVPPYSVVAGNPATVVRYRFSEEVIEQLLTIAWWNWPIEKITKHLHQLTGNDVQALIEASR